MKYEVVVGLEIHVETKTNTKMFSAASTIFNAPVNTNVALTDMAFPGTMPLVNKQAVINAIKLCHALNLKIDHELHFDRKNYFYSDLPKGYQITQQRRPIGTDGYLNIYVGDEIKKIRIERLHMEEDTAKQLHLADRTLVDYNRAGLPLVEIVTKPDLRSGEEASKFVESIREIVTYTNVSDGKMEEGSLRCDVNISMRPVGTTKLGAKVEIKNLNSISNVGRVVDIEIERQTALLKQGEVIKEETRRFDEANKTTVLMRVKDDSVDYKYFPEANIAPIKITEQFVKQVIDDLAELPSAKRERYIKQFKLNNKEIDILLADKDYARYFDEAAIFTKDYKTLINWVNGELSAYLNKSGVNINNLKLTPTNFAGLINLIADGKVSNKQARDLFDVIVETNEDPTKKAQELNLLQVSDEGFILKIVNEVIDENLGAIDDIKNGKDRALGFLVGQVMKKSQGKVNPALANKVMRDEILKR